MNRFFTLLLAASCLTAVGQVDVTYPYNPDSGDGSIGSSDLIELLTLYGTLFEPEALMVNEIPFQDWVDAVNNTLLSQQTLIDSLMGSGVNQTDPCEGLTSVNYHGVEYPVVAVGDQCWFAKDLATELYNDGTLINDYDPYPWLTQLPEGIIYSSDLFFSIGAQEDTWGVYAPYVGSLENEKKVCPIGWGVPTLEDLGQLWLSSALLTVDNGLYTISDGVGQSYNFDLRANWSSHWRQWQGFVSLSSVFEWQAYPNSFCQLTQDELEIEREIRWRCHLDSLQGNCDAIQNLASGIIAEYGYDENQVNISTYNEWGEACHCFSTQVQIDPCLDPYCEEYICNSNHIDGVSTSPRSFLDRTALLYSDYENHLDDFASSQDGFYWQSNLYWGIELGPLPTLIWHEGEHILPPEQAVEEIMTPFTRLPIRCIKDSE